MPSFQFSVSSLCLLCFRYVSLRYALSQHSSILSLSLSLSLPLFHSHCLGLACISSQLCQRFAQRLKVCHTFNISHFSCIFHLVFQLFAGPRILVATRASKGLLAGCLSISARPSQSLSVTFCSPLGRRITNYQLVALLATPTTFTPVDLSFLQTDKTPICLCYLTCGSFLACAVVVVVAVVTITTCVKLFIIIINNVFSCYLWTHKQTPTHTFSSCLTGSSTN